MIQSMTGYGRADVSHALGNFIVEVKALNSKFADMNITLPSILNNYMLQVRSMVKKKLIRGKIGVVIEYIPIKKSLLEQSPINQKLFTHYYHILKNLSNEIEVNVSDSSIFQFVLQIPAVMHATVDDIEVEQKKIRWEIVEGVLKNALEQCSQVRYQEGMLLHKQILEYIGALRENLKNVILLAPKRIENIHEKLYEKLCAVASKEQIEENKLEQEMVYHIDRIDLTEEMVRLENHFDFFEKIMDQERSEGRQLGFIAQEMGREINTIGAKANDAAIQKIVVIMKDYLEKIKEQLQNIL